MTRLPYREEALTFDAIGARLVAIVTTPDSADRVRAPVDRPGVLIVVGGPQYRVGSHRQFVLLARALAARGYAVMRFDCTGMGDSSGPEQPFTHRDADIRTAIDAFVAHVPTLRRIAIWGLCDAASAALFYAPSDARVSHLVLLNPWVRSDTGLARTHLKHYYLSRFTSRAFWSQVLRGKVHIGRALGGLGATVRRARAGRSDQDDSASLTFQARMARGWKRFRGDVLLICSGDDLTAREFLDHAAGDAEWKGLLDDVRVTRCTMADADHTFSRAAWRDEVAERTGDWLDERIGATRPAGPRGTREPARAGRQPV